MTKLTHADGSGRARMVDVGDKPISARRAVARGILRFGDGTAFAALVENRLAKGDALAVARLAGIQAAKRTHEWIPLCHAVPLDQVRVDIELDAERRTAAVTAEARARWHTGVEMEALVAVSGACLALYDMVKGLDRTATIAEIALVEKEGGRSGLFRRGGSAAEG